MTNNYYTLPLLLFLLLAFNLKAAISQEISNDPHYSAVGFFDVHICNWPNRTNYFKILFSTEKYNEIDSMNVFTPDKKLFITLDKKKYKVLKTKNKPDKRVFMIDIDVPDTATTGWYSINVKTKNGNNYQAKGYVILNGLNRASDLQPNSPDKKYKFPITLSWKPVSGAKHYKVFVKDEWTGKVIFKSKLIDNNKIILPNNKLKTGGWYSWRVHARDTNEHILLGDFNMGSMSIKAELAIAE